MSGDYSRFTFDPALNQGGVLLQQGRPLTDADWNEQVATANRRAQAAAADVFAPTPLTVAVVPATTPDAFLITATGGPSPAMTISPGRMYVDGLLVENHGDASGATSWDPVLAETVGLAPVNYNNQPYLFNAPPLPVGGPFLVFLDVWQREVTPAQRPDLVEPALGVDTTTRLQTVWQVRVLPSPVVATDGTAVGPTTPLSLIQGWNAFAAPSAGLLTVTSQSPTTPTDAGPCPLPPSTGFRGLENQLYRIEIHDPGVPGTATFKWSRDNASVETVIDSITGDSTSTTFLVQSTGKDDVLRFNVGDWIEVIDDVMELTVGAPGGPGGPGKGTLCRVTTVDDVGSTVTVAGVVAADVTHHARIRRWDQQGTVLHADGQTPYFNVDTGNGAIPVPTDPSVQLLLESGIVVSFDTASAGGTMRVADYWTFTARTGGGLQALTKAPPQGVHHHYAKLAILNNTVTSTTAVPDLRTSWPLSLVDANTCGFTVCVTPLDHSSHARTINAAVAMVMATGGTVLLSAGDYTLAQSIDIVNGSRVQIRGQGSSTRILFEGRAFNIQNSQGILLSDLAIQAGGAQTTSTFEAIFTQATTGLRLEQVAVAAQSSSPVSAISLNDSGDLFMRDCDVNSSDTAVVFNLRSSFSAGLQIDGCNIAAPKGVSLATALVRGAQNFGLDGRIVNSHFNCTEYSIGVPVGPGDGRFLVDSNEFMGGGPAITGYFSTLDFTDNYIRFTDTSSQVAIRLFGVESSLTTATSFQQTIPQRATARIAGNVISDVAGTAIMIDGLWDDVSISDNRITGSTGAISFGVNSVLNTISIVSNRISQMTIFGIIAENARSVRIHGNVLHDIATGVFDHQGNFFGHGIATINVVDCDISSNEIMGVGPDAPSIGAVFGIAIAEPMVAAVVRGNTVRRRMFGSTPASFSENWAALVVGASVEDFSRGFDDPLGVPFLYRTAGLANAGDIPTFVPFDQLMNNAGGIPGFGNQDPTAGPAVPVVPDLGILDPTIIERVVVEGNVLESAAENPTSGIVRIESSGDVIFSNNHTYHRSFNLVIGRDSDTVGINAITALVSSNVVRTTGINLTTPAGAPTTIQVTAVGNFGSGITVDHVALTAPFQNLNR
jgi:hypothetical protein